MELIKQCPIELPCGPITREQKYYHEFEKTLTSLMPLYNDFFVDLIGVTFTVGDTFYLDEKEVRPILCMTPFIIYGTNGHLESMRGTGFKTFNQWWDESYDDVEDPVQRLSAIGDVMAWICGHSLEQLQAMLISMQPVLEHNYQLFNSTEFLDSCWTELTDNLDAVEILKPLSI